MKVADFRCLYTTLPSLAAAKSLARVLVKKKLVACANLIPVTESLYSWKGKVQCGREWALILKTHKAKISRLKENLLGLHPYECPCIIVFGAKDVSAAYLAWVADSLKFKS